jgi:hypothetical protein
MVPWSATTEPGDGVYAQTDAPAHQRHDYPGSPPDRGGGWGS